ncbi:hypothetical protein [Pedobacter aquatilis]|uniref:hypothetical protein n=1 Tax=Pedobacter aquatilis TaxID=351343 RepID=UPI00292FC6DF|nr:hypothetical protein [Pedobacter aquatilis]
MHIDKLDFKVYFDGILFQPLLYAVSVCNRVNNTRFALRKVSDDQGERILIEGSAIETDFIASLGSSFCHILYNWNSRLEDENKKKKIFASFAGQGFQNYQPTPIDLPTDYLNELVASVKGQNLSTKVSESAKSFKLNSVNPEHLFPSAYEYNLKFKADFLIIKVELLHYELYFAWIEFNRAQPIDIFCMSFDLMLQTEYTYEEMRKRNQQP